MGNAVMDVVGIVAEYNPLHNGHVYHIEEALSRSGADHCIVCMSGNFVQRGEAACADKYTRAGWALSCGADIVIELPAVYALSPAQKFASAGVRILSGTGVVTHLSFGAESDDTETLQSIARTSLAEPDLMKNQIAKGLSEGKSYPKAYYEAVIQTLGEKPAELIRTPNNILAIEYLKAIAQFSPSILPVPVLRKGASYDDTTLNGIYSSATGIRNALKSADDNAYSSVPASVSGYFSANPGFPKEEMLHAMLYSTLRKAEKQYLADLPEVCEGLENKFYEAVRHHSNLNSVLEEVKSKRYTLAKLKRTALHALLGIDNMAANVSPYINVLGFKKSARALLSEIAEKASIPLIVRSRDARTAPDQVQQSLRIDALSTDLFACIATLPIRKDHSGAIVF